MTENHTFLSGNASRSSSSPRNSSQSPVTSSPTVSGDAWRSSHGMAACSSVKRDSSAPPWGCRRK